MTLTTELSPDMYEGYIKSLQGERDRLEADNENLQKEFDAALVHIEWLTGEHKAALAEAENLRAEAKDLRDIIKRQQRQAAHRGIA